MRLFYQIARSATTEGSGGAPAAEAPAAAAAAPAPAADTILTAPPAPDPAAAEPPAPVVDPAAAEPPAKGEEAAPITAADYKIEVPAGVDPENALYKAFLDGAAKGGMDNDSVQAVISELGPKMAEQLAAPLKAWQETNAAWRAEITADPEIGGAKLDATVATVQSAIDLVCAPEQAQAVRAALVQTGAGNNPAIIRLLHGMASRLVEGGAVSGSAPAAAAQSAADILYPTHSAGKAG